MLLLALLACNGVETGDTSDTNDTNDTDTDTDTDTDFGPDTCTGGDNMADPRVASSVAPRVVLTWDEGVALPDAYFAAVALDPRSDDPLETAVSEVSYQSPREIVVTFPAFPDTSGALVLAFPDRRDHIDCEHPGMDDVYWLRANLDFSGGAPAATGFEQGVDLGDI